MKFLWDISRLPKVMCTPQMYPRHPCFPAQGSIIHGFPQMLSVILPWGPPSPIKSNGRTLQIALIKLLPALQEGTVEVLPSMENFWEIDTEPQIKVALWSIVWSGRLVSGKHSYTNNSSRHSPQTVVSENQKDLWPHHVPTLQINYKHASSTMFPL